MPRFLLAVATLAIICVLPAFALQAGDPPAVRPAVLHFGLLPALAAKPMPQPCPCGPDCRCNPCRCGQQMAADDPLANGVLLARLNQHAEDRRPLLPAAEERLIERKQIEGLLSSIASFVGGALEFFAVWSWMRANLWLMPASIFGGCCVIAFALMSRKSAS